jgi:small subunit ribosomal protein S9
MAETAGIQTQRVMAVGKRKTAVARIILKPGSGKILVNGKAFEDYFKRPTLELIVNQPFKLTNTVGKYDVSANVCGGGLSGQADAIKYGIAKALLKVDEGLRTTLKQAGLLTRDARIVERKKYGKHKARRSHQYSKR